MLKFARKALFVVALPVVGALGVTHYEKVTALLPDFGAAARSEFQLADACLGCGTITEQAEGKSAFCTACGATEVKEVVAAKLTSGWMHIGWQLPDGQTILLDCDGCEYEIPPLRVRGDSTKTLTRF